MGADGRGKPDKVGITVKPGNARVAELLRRYPDGITSKQIAALARLSPRSVRQVLYELRQDGYRIAEVFVLRRDPDEGDRA